MNCELKALCTALGIGHDGCRQVTLTAAGSVQAVYVDGWGRTRTIRWLRPPRRTA